MIARLARPSKNVDRITTVSAWPVRCQQALGQPALLQKMVKSCRLPGITATYPLDCNLTLTGAL